MARVELVAKPAHFASLILSGIPGTYQKSLWSKITEEHAVALYDDLEPTPERVAALMTTESDETELSSVEKQTYSWLKDTILSLDEQTLASFLHFVTGSTTLPQTLILVSLNNREGLSGTPSAHTCGNLLEISTKYESRQELEQELLQVLSTPEAYEMMSV